VIVVGGVGTVASNPLAAAGIVSTVIVAAGTGIMSQTQTLGKINLEIKSLRGTVDVPKTLRGTADVFDTLRGTIKVKEL